MSYWTNRQEQLKKTAEKDEAAIKKRLSKFYDAEFKRLDKEIAAYYQRYGEGNVIEYRQLMESLSDEDKRLLIQQMDEFATKYPQYADLMPVRESIYKLDRLQGLQCSVAMAQANIAGYTNEQIKAYETSLAQKGLNYAMETLGFGKNFYSLNSDAVRQFVDVAWSNGENFSTRIWNDTQKLAQYLNQDMAQGFARGDSYDRLVRNLKKRFDRVNRNDAYRLVFTEGTYVMAESTMQPFKEDFEQYRLSPVLDGRTCPVCRSLREQVFFISERQPGVNFPPIHPWCRCTWEIVVDDWDRWIDDYVEKHSGGRKQAGMIARRFGNKKVDDDEEYYAPGTSYHGIITVHRSLGAAAKRYNVKLAEGNSHTRLAENQVIEGKTFAGKGTNVEIRDRFRLERDYGIPASEWEKVSGKGYIIKNGKRVLVELHWYEANGEVYEMKEKRHIDEG